MTSHWRAHKCRRYHPGSHFPSRFSRSRFLSSHKGAHCAPTGFQFGRKLKAGVALLFHLGGGQEPNTTGLLVSVVPGPHA